MNNTFRAWLYRYFGTTDFLLTPLAGDASFRLYFRVQQAGKTWIAMDASAERDRCPQFIAIANALRNKGLNTPEIFAKDLKQGFLLLSDFGDDLYLKRLTTSANAEELYGCALDALSILSTCASVEGYQIPSFTTRFMREELNLFQEWFLEKHLGINLSQEQQDLLAQDYDLIATNCGAQPQVFMHRDYHSANLMVLPDNRVGILDFQDAFIGPVTYDLVSLLRDCYIDWPNDLVEKWVLQYRDKISMRVNDAEFLRWFDWMGVQRHLKALLTFSRKYRRDQNANYLQFIPRTLNYVLQVTHQYPELHSLNHFLKENVWEQVSCVP